MGKTLWADIHQDNASKLGITVDASAEAKSQHSLNVIMGAADRQNVAEFMEPFAQMGIVEVKTGITCEAIVARGKC